MKVRWSLIALLLLTILACQVPVLQQPQNVPAAGQPPAPTPPPVITAPAEQPTQPAVTVPLLLPRGFAAVSGDTLAFFEKNGAQFAQMQASESIFWEPGRVHLAGSMPPGSQTIPMLFFAFDDGETLRYRDATGQIFNLMQGQSFISLTGVPAQPVASLAQIEYLDTALRSRIYAGSIQSLPTAAPLLSIDDPEFWAVKPVALDAQNGSPARIWYTRIPYGIGGDIVFEPRKSLSYMDVASGQSVQVLGNEASPWDFTADRQWVAYSKFGEGTPGGMALYNLQTGAGTAYSPIAAAEPRGAGDAFFSPGGQRLAWMEGDGWLMADIPNYHATIRVGDLNGNVVAEFPDSFLAASAPAGQASWVQPVGWLDDQTLLIQARGTDWADASVLKVDLATGTAAYLAPGVFIGVIYP